MAGRHRMFDYDLVRTLHTNGSPVRDLAEQFGVSRTTIYRAIDDGFRARQYANARRIINSKRRPCDNGCGTLVWGHTRSRRPDGHICCRRCKGLLAATSVRPDTLLCSHCDRWLPDEEFPKASAAIARRGRHGECRSCQTITRRERRRRAAA